MRRFSHCRITSRIYLVTVVFFTSDALVGNATAGITSFGGISYTTTSEDITGRLPAGDAGVNHGMSSFSLVLRRLHG